MGGMQTEMSSRITANSAWSAQMEVKVSIIGHLKKRKKESFALVGQTMGSRESEGPYSSPVDSHANRSCKLSPHCVPDTGLHLFRGTAGLGSSHSSQHRWLSLVTYCNTESPVRTWRPRPGLSANNGAGPGFNPNPASEPLLQSVL